MATKKATTKGSTYEPVSRNIYSDGTSYRVRKTINGERYSRNFKSKTKAFAYRKELANMA